MRPATLAHLLLLAVVLVWGATFVLIKSALADTSPLLFVLLRMTIAAGILALVYRREFMRMSRPALASGAVVGVCLGAGYALQTSGLRLTTPSKSAFLTGLVVVIVPLLSLIPAVRAPGAHRPRWTAGCGAVLAFAGLLLLTMPPMPAGDRLTAALLVTRLFGGFGRGELLTLGCAVAYALHMLAISHAAARVRYTQLAVLQVGFAALTIALVLPFFEPHPFLRPTAAVLCALAIAAFFATAAAFTIQSWAQQYLPATHTAVILTLEPVFAWLTSFLFLGERLGARSGSGALLILVGIALAELWPEPKQLTAHEAASLP